MKVKWFRGGARDPGSQMKEGRVQTIRGRKKGFRNAKGYRTSDLGSSLRRGGNMKPGTDTHTRGETKTLKS